MNLDTGSSYYLAVSWGVFAPDQSWWSPARAELTGNDAVAKAFPIDGDFTESSASALKWGAAVAVAAASLL